MVMKDNKGKITPIQTIVIISVDSSHRQWRRSTCQRKDMWLDCTTFETSESNFLFSTLRSNMICIAAEKDDVLCWRRAQCHDSIIHALQCRFGQTMPVPEQQLLFWGGYPIFGSSSCTDTTSIRIRRTPCELVVGRIFSKFIGLSIRSWLQKQDSHKNFLHHTSLGQPAPVGS